jgi:hypothetical protein
MNSIKLSNPYVIAKETYKCSSRERKEFFDKKQEDASLGTLVSSSIYEEIQKDLKINESIETNFHEKMNPHLCFLYLEDETFVLLHEPTKTYLEIIKNLYSIANIPFEYETSDIIIENDIFIKKPIILPVQQKKDLLSYLDNYKKIYKLQNEMNQLQNLTNTFESKSKSVNELVKPIQNKHDEKAKMSVSDAFLQTKKSESNNYKYPIFSANTKNMSLQARDEPIIEKKNIGHWNNSSIEVDPLLLNKYDSIFSNKSCLSEVEPFSSWSTSQFTNIASPANIVYIIIHIYTMKTLVLSNISKEEEYILNNCPQFGFTIYWKHSTTQTKLIEIIKNLFHSIDHIYEDIDDVFNIMKKYVENYENKENLCSEEESICGSLKKMFDFNDSPENKMKASDLHNLCKNFSPVKIDNDHKFINRLSKYFTKLGLLKKRYSDGYYYYGIVRKNPTQIKEAYEPSPYIPELFNTTHIDDLPEYTKLVKK